MHEEKSYQECQQKYQIALEILNFFQSRKIGIRAAAAASRCHTFVIENLANDVKYSNEIGFSISALEDWLKRLKTRDRINSKK